tara:strand:- start:332 stop:535 length:204 start_codon:yes stop_codon:yes gene_type:complete
MYETPWIAKKSISDITDSTRKSGGLDDLDISGYLYFFKNGETRHCNDDSEAHIFYGKNKERLDTTKE